MSPEQKGHGSGSSRITRHELDFSNMDEEMVREKRRQLAPVFGVEEDSEELENVIQTPFEDYVLVKHDGVFNMVRYEGGAPKLISWEEVQNLPKVQQWCNDYFD
jgi:hypothetical protein